MIEMQMSQHDDFYVFRFYVFRHHAESGQPGHEIWLFTAGCDDIHSIPTLHLGNLIDIAEPRVDENDLPGTLNEPNGYEPNGYRNYHSFIQRTVTPGVEKSREEDSAEACPSHHCAGSLHPTPASAHERVDAQKQKVAECEFPPCVNVEKYATVGVA